MPKSPYTLKINWKITFTSKILFGISLVSLVLWIFTEGWIRELSLTVFSVSLIFAIFAFGAEKTRERKLTSKEYEEIYGEKP